MLLIRFVFLLPFGFVLLACNDDDLDSNSVLLAENIEKWGSDHLNYQYDYRNICFCPPEITDHVSITVLNEVIDSAAFTNSGQTVDPSLYPNFRTVNQMFGLIQSAIDRGASSLSVTYHPTLGYPSLIDIDYDQKVADEELGVSVANLILL